MIKMTAIRPREVDWGAIRGEVQKGVDAFGKLLLDAAEGTTESWKDRPRFTLRVSMGHAGDEITAVVSTEDMRWKWTDEGTRPHIIRARNAPMLAFASTFQPKTRPNNLVSAGGFVGPVDTFRKQVNHPGTEPRNFTATIKRQLGPRFRGLVHMHLIVALKRSGQLMSEGGPSGMGD